MRFFSEFALLARDLHDAVDLYRAECRPGQADQHVLDPARLRHHLDQTKAQIEALASQAAVPDDRLRDYLNRMQRLGIAVDLPITEVADPEPGAVVDPPADLDLERFLADEHDHGQDRVMTTPSRPRLSSSSSCRRDMNMLKSPEMPTISSHSQAIMSLRYHQAAPTHSDNAGKHRASPARVVQSEFEQIPGFVRSRVTLDEVNDVLGRVSIGDQITSDHLETELGFGSKAKAVIMVLQQLDRARSSCREDGEVCYEVTAGPTTS